MFVLKNRVEIVAQLAGILRQFDVDCNKYDTDVYLYYNADTQTAELETFENVGGCNWMGDDHVCIYRDYEHVEPSMWDWVQTKREFSDLLGMSEEELAAEVGEYYKDREEACKFNYYDYKMYVQSNDKYVLLISEAYEDFLNDIFAEYNEKAEEIINKFENSDNYYYDAKKDCDYYKVIEYYDGTTEKFYLFDKALDYIKEKYSADNMVELEVHIEGYNYYENDYHGEEWSVSCWNELELYNILYGEGYSEEVNEDEF